MYFETPKKNTRKNRSISKPKPLQASSSLEKKGKDKENFGIKNGGINNNGNNSNF